MKCYSWKICALVLLCTAIALDGVSAKKKANNKYEGDFEFVDEDDKATMQKLTPEKKKWIHDPSSDLCRPLNCKKKELCLLEDANTAVCVLKKELHKTRDEVLPKAVSFRSNDDALASSLSSAKWKWPETDDADSMDESDDLSEEDDIFYDSEAVIEPVPPVQAQQQHQIPDEEKCKRCAVTKPIFVCASDNRTYSSFCRLDYHNCIHGTSLKIVCKGFCPCRDQGDKKDKQQQQQKANNKSSFRPSNPVFDNTDRSVNTIGDNDVNVASQTLDRKYYSVGDKNKMMSNHIPMQQNQYQFTPEDIKFDNKHYKYLKYTAMKTPSKTAAAAVPSVASDSSSDGTRFEDKHKYRMYNENKSNKMAGLSSGPSGGMSNKIGGSGSSALGSAVECKAQQLTAIGNRLLDWFSVIMADSKKRRQHSPKPKGHFPPTCKMESKWMFGHLDLNNDGLLSAQELYDLEHDQNERCIKPFIDACSQDQDTTMSPREWCRCFEKTDRPCAAVRRRLSNELLGSYAPDCDVQGFYKATQCHSSVGVCWCVDKHGVEFANTRTRGNKPNCDEVINSATATITSDDEDDAEERNGGGQAKAADTSSKDIDQDDDEDSAEGSADRMLVF